MSRVALVALVLNLLLETGAVALALFDVNAAAKELLGSLAPNSAAVVAWSIPILALVVQGFFALLQEGGRGVSLMGFLVYHILVIAFGLGLFPVKTTRPKEMRLVMMLHSAMAILTAAGLLSSSGKSEDAKKST